MSNRFAGNISLICPDCGTPLVSHASHSERYKCADCDLVLRREGQRFTLVRHGDVVGQRELEEMDYQVTWRVGELAAV